MIITLNYKKLLAMGLIGAGLSLFAAFAFAQTAATGEMHEVVVDYLTQYYPEVATVDTTTEAGQDVLNHYFQELNDQSSLTLAADLSLYAEQVGVPEETVTAFQEEVWGDQVVTTLDHIEEVVQQTAEDQGTSLTGAQLLQEVVEVITPTHISPVDNSAGVELLQEIVTNPVLTAVLDSGIEGGFNSEEFVAEEIQPAVEITEQLVSGEVVQIGGAEYNNPQDVLQAFNSNYVASYQEGDVSNFINDFFGQLVNPGDVAKYVSNAQVSSAEAFGDTVKAFAQQMSSASGASSVANNPAFAAMAKIASEMGATVTAKSAMASFMDGYSAGSAGNFNSLQDNMMKGFSGVQEFTAQAYDPAKASEFAAQMQQAMGSQQGLANFMGEHMGEHFDGAEFSGGDMREFYTSVRETGGETGFNNLSPAEMSTMMAAGAQQYQQMQQSGQFDYGGNFGGNFGGNLGGNYGENQSGQSGGFFGGLFGGTSPSDFGGQGGAGVPGYGSTEGFTMPAGFTAGMTPEQYAQSPEGAGHQAGGPSTGFGGFTTGGFGDFANFADFKGDSGSFSGFSGFSAPGSDFGTATFGTHGGAFPDGTMQGYTQGMMPQGMTGGTLGGAFPDGTMMPQGMTQGIMQGYADHSSTLGGMTGPTGMTSGPTSGYTMPSGDFGTSFMYAPPGVTFDSSGATTGNIQYVPPPTSGDGSGSFSGGYMPPPSGGYIAPSGDGHTGDGGGGYMPPPPPPPASLYGIYRTYYYPYSWGY